MTKKITISETPRSLFMVLSSLEACKSRVSYLDAGHWLMGVAQRAYTVRDFGAVAEVGRALSSSPLRELFQGAGDYYRALSVGRYGQGDAAGALDLYLKAASRAGSRLRARAFVGAGVAATSLGRYSRAGEFYNEALLLSVRQRTLDAATVSYAIRGRAVLDSIEGDHERALNSLERGRPLLPCVYTQSPAAAYDYQNSVAVELANCGKFEEARAMLRPALASPYAPFHKVWTDTHAEIEALDPHVPTNRVYMPSNMGHLSRNVVEFPERPTVRPKDEGEELEKVVDQNSLWSRERSRTPALIRQNARHHLFIREYQKNVDQEEGITGGSTDGGRDDRAG